MWAGMEALPGTVRVRGQRRFDLTSGPPYADPGGLSHVGGLAGRGG